MLLSPEWGGRLWTPGQWSQPRAAPERDSRKSFKTPLGFQEVEADGWILGASCEKTLQILCGTLTHFPKEHMCTDGDAGPQLMRRAVHLKVWLVSCAPGVREAGCPLQGTAEQGSPDHPLPPPPVKRGVGQRGWPA